MKKSILLFSVLFFMMKIAAQDVQKLCDAGNFIALSHLGIENWEDDNFSIPFLKATVYNAMARFEESNKEIDSLLLKSDVKENPNLMISVLRLQASNYVKMLQYKQAADGYKKIIDNYGNLLGEGIGNWQNAYRMYMALSEIDRLQVNIPHDTKIQIKYDKVGLPKMQVRTPKDTVSLVLDTGASFSIVAESVASRLGINILADSLTLGGGIANTEYMKIGFVDTLYLGDILYQNVFFGVVNDDKMTLPEYIDVSINGVIGFPEIKALSSIKIHKNGILEIAENDNKCKSNMMFSESNHFIVQVNDSLLFMFDTGNTNTMLSINYFNKNKEFVENAGDTCYVFQGSMGGIKDFPVYELSNFPIKINSTTNVLPKISCYREPMWATVYEYDGNLGQDVIQKYDYMLLDFKNMCFSLGNEN